MSWQYDDFIEIMRKIISQDDKLERASQEIQMWRNKFLSELPLKENKEEAACLWMGFLSIPTQKFLENSPLEHVKNIEERWMKNQHLKN